MRQDTIYDLKMINGQSVDLYFNLQNTKDLDTGTVSATKSRLNIRRVVITSLVSKYKFFAPSDGTYQKDDTLLLVDYRDLKEYDQLKDDYFVIKGKKYLIVTHEFITNEGHIFVIRHVQNDPPNQELTLNIRHFVPIGVSNDQS